MYNHGGAVVNWTVSKEMQAANFKDSFREIHPDPAKNIGTTWLTDVDSLETPRRFDRIDYIYYQGKTIKAKESQCYDNVLGQQFSFNGEDFFYASDHGFVLTTFTIKQLFLHYDLLDDWSLMTVWDEGQGWNRLGDDKVCFLAHGNRTMCITHSHSIGRIDSTCIE